MYCTPFKIFKFLMINSDINEIELQKYSSHYYYTCKYRKSGNLTFYIKGIMVHKFTLNLILNFKTYD